MTAGETVQAYYDRIEAVVIWSAVMSIVRGIPAVIVTIAMRNQLRQDAGGALQGQQIFLIRSDQREDQIT